MCIRDRLKSILGLIDPLSGSVEQGDYLEIGYFEQEMSQDISTTCIEEIWKEFPGYSQYAVAYTHLDVYKRQRFSCSNLPIS